MNRSRLTVLTIMALVLVLLAWPAVAHAETDETIERVSVDKTGGDSDGSSQTSSISADGQSVVFGSSATDLVATDANGNTGDIFVRDLVAGTTELVSVSSDEVQGDKVSSQPDISPDGRYVAFQSLADNLVSGDGAYVDIFVRDLAEGTTMLMSRNSDGTAANGDSSRASIAADEERVYVAYDSVATNLVAPGIDTNGTTRSIFVSYYWKSDPSTVITTLVDRRTDGSLGINPNGSGNPDISADGCYVAYESFFWNERTPDGLVSTEVVYEIRSLRS